MTRSIFLSLAFHAFMIVATALSLPFMLRSPIDLPPILSVDLIEITDTTSIPFAAKAAKTLEKIKKKEEEERVVSEQAPPAEKKKEKPDRIPLPEDLNKEKLEKIINKITENKKPIPGSYKERKSSEPENTRKTLLGNNNA